MPKSSKYQATRRSFIKAVGTGATAAAMSGALSANASGPVFSHGVASGDPTQSAIILWTRLIDEADKSKPLAGEWQVSEAEDFAQIAAGGTFRTGPKSDHTVKVDAIGLKPGTDYHYRFITKTDGGEQVISPVGRTRTLPEKTDKIALAVVSCSNYSHGFFHVYKELSTRPFAAVLHLGDYIYEYGQGVYDNPKALEQGRTPEPVTETISLDDYRRRYALYRTDPSLQAAHAAHPFICVWDDHEVANDTWKGGAENHSDDEGEFLARRRAALQAYFEWLPIREGKSQEIIYRSFELGDIASLIMLDTRNIGRDKPLSYSTDLPPMAIPFDFSDPKAPVAVLDAEALKHIAPEHIKHVPVPFKVEGGKSTPMTDWAEIQTLDPKALPAGYTYLPDAKKFKTEILPDPNRSLLGAEQESWLAEKLSASKIAGKPWQILGQQVLCGKVGIPKIDEKDLDINPDDKASLQRTRLFRMLAEMGLPLNMDAWDGYPASRDKLFEDIKAKAANTVFLAGDTHNAWAFDLADKASAPVATELATASVSSPGLEKYVPASPQLVANKLMEASPELKYTNTKDRGWLELSLTKDKISARWLFVDTVLDESYTARLQQSAHVKAGSPKLILD